ncbi:MAG TPA: hypothetical protein VF011_18735 [Terriglobales bacterium]
MTMHVAGLKNPCAPQRKPLVGLSFQMNGREYDAIEQNPEKPSRWGRLARTGHQIVQFLDRQTRRFVAVAIDGKVKECGALRQGD